MKRWQVLMLVLVLAMAILTPGQALAQWGYPEAPVWKPVPEMPTWNPVPEWPPYSPSYTPCPPRETPAVETLHYPGGAAYMGMAELWYQPKKGEWLVLESVFGPSPIYASRQDCSIAGEMFVGGTKVANIKIQRGKGDAKTFGELVKIAEKRYSKPQMR